MPSSPVSPFSCGKFMQQMRPLRRALMSTATSVLKQQQIAISAVKIRPARSQFRTTTVGTPQQQQYSLSPGWLCTHATYVSGTRLRVVDFRRMYCRTQGCTDTHPQALGDTHRAGRKEHGRCGVLQGGHRAGSAPSSTSLRSPTTAASQAVQLISCDDEATFRNYLRRQGLYFRARSNCGRPHTAGDGRQARAAQQSPPARSLT